MILQKGLHIRLVLLLRGCLDIACQVWLHSSWSCYGLHVPVKVSSKFSLPKVGLMPKGVSHWVNNVCVRQLTADLTCIPTFWQWLPESAPKANL